jgi:hypothetical protein
MTTVTLPWFGGTATMGAEGYTMRRTTMIAIVLSAMAALFAVAQDDLAGVITKPVCEAAFTIPAHSSKTCTFSVPEGLHKVQLAGQFSATGGPHNSIVVWVLNDDQFVNWQNRHLVKPIYNSQKVTQGTVKVPITDPGKYHVVFNNDFSLLTPKAVEAKMILQYTR